MPVTSHITMLTDRGQVQVPAWVREKLELQTGQKFAWRILADGDLQVHVIRQESTTRRAQWRGYVQSVHGERTSDEVLAEVRAGDDDTKRLLGL